MQPLLRSLLLRFMVVAVPLLLVFVVFNFVFVTQGEQRVLAEELRKRAISVARNLALNGAQAREGFGDYLLGPLARAAARLPDVAWVAFTDEKGHLLVAAGPQEGVVHQAGPLQEAAMHQQEAVLRIEADGAVFVGVSQPMASRAGALGVVLLGLRTDSLGVAAAGARADALMLSLLLALAILTLTLPLVYWTVAPVRLITRTARDLASGDLSARVPSLRRDELGRLGVALNGMATRLESIVERERAKRAELERRVIELRTCSEQVALGHLDVRAHAGDDELGKLAAGFNAMVDHLQQLVERERAMQKDLEANQSVLQSANARLMLLDRKKSDFLNTVSHELRTPLTSIKAFSEILAEQDTAEVNNEFLQIIDQEADRLTRLIEDLLDLSRIEDGQMAQTLIDVSLDAVVEGCVRSCRALAELKEIHLFNETHEPLNVRGDRDRLAQVVTNLLSNAIKFTPRGGSVHVTGGREDGGVSVAIRDTGVGIAERDLGRIFEKFQQVDRPEPGGKHIVGSGLGLPIVKSIVEAHGGRVWVESVMGEGSTFHVWLPGA